MEASPNVSFGEKSYRDIAVTNRDDQDQDEQYTTAQSVATMGVASIIYNQSAQSEILLIQAYIQSTIETSMSAMTA